MKKLFLTVSLFLFFVFNFSLSFGQSWKWAKQGIGSYNKIDEGEGVAIDKIGSVYITGYFQDTITLGSDSFKTGHSFYSCYLIKYDGHGNIVWYKQSTGGISIQSEQFSSSVAVDKSGNVYITGNFVDTAYFGAIRLIGPSNLRPETFIVKYDSLGNVLWAKQSMSGGNGYGQGNSVSVDGQNNVYITGKFADSITFNTYKLYGSSYFIAKYDPNGNLLWASAPPNGRNSIGYSIVGDSIGNTYLTGLFSDTLNLGRDTIRTSGIDEYFLVKYNTNGNPIWAQQCTNVSDARGYSLTLDAAGNIYTTGYYYGAADFNGITLTAYSANNVFLARYDSSGKCKWVKNSVLLNSGQWEGYSLSADKYSNIYISAGSPSNIPDIKFGSKVFSLSYGSAPSVIVEYDSSGSALCGSVIGYGGDDPGGIAVSPEGNFLYLTGDLEDTVTFGPDRVGPITNNNEWIFLAKWQTCNSVPSDITELNKNETINVYPNPFHNSTTVVVNDEGNHSLEVYDITGRKLQSIEFAGKQYELSAQGLAKGMYFIRVFDGQNALIGTSKILVE